MSFIASADGPRSLLILLIAFFCGLGGCRGEPPRPLPRASLERVLFLGNSTTRHPQSPQIGWSGDWGMAASAPDKDFAHLVVQGLARQSGRALKMMATNIADFERGLGAYDIDERLKAELAFQPTLVIVAIGENARPLTSDAAKTAFEAGFRKLLLAVAKNRRTSLIVRSCFLTHNKAKDQIMNRVCREFNGTWVDIHGLAREESNLARSEGTLRDEAGCHPGDRGMRAIADAILRSITVVND